jgi:hypothetical protein
MACRYKIYKNKGKSTTKTHSVHLLIFLYISVTRPLYDPPPPPIITTFPRPILFLPVSGWFVAALQPRCVLPLCESQNIRTDCQKWHSYNLEIPATHIYKTGISRGGGDLDERYP